jgi:hypothetical protein
MALFARLVSFLLVVFLVQSGPALGLTTDTVAMKTPSPASHNMVIAKADPADSGKKKNASETIWRSQELSLLAVGLGVGDVDGDGKNEIVIASPSTVYLYRFSENTLSLLTEYSAGSLEIKAIDVAKIRKDGPARIYVTAQNRGSVASFVLEHKNGSLVPVIENVGYFLRVINYPTHGPILLGQRKGLSQMYDGPIYRMEDKGSSLEAGDRFGVPLKIPIFGFAIGDFEGKRKPLIVVYDKSDHLRLYNPDGKRMYLSKDYYGGSDIILRWFGPEDLRDRAKDLSTELVYVRPRIGWWRPAPDAPAQVLCISHSSGTMRMLSRTKMFEEGRIMGLAWNGDALDQRWSTPKAQGMIVDFSVDTLSGLSGERLIVLERKKTDWLAFLLSRSQVKIYDLQQLVSEGDKGERTEPEK